MPHLSTNLLKFLLAWLSLGVLLGVRAEAALAVDTLRFGDPESEQSHALATGWGPTTPKSWVGTWTPPSEPSATPPSDVVDGAFGQKVRRLLPRTPNPDVYGGEASFSMAVDPLQQNYFTVKWWGSDPSGGRWFILDVAGLELGNRHGGGADAPDILNNIDMRWAPNRFIYRTVAIPFHLTRGRRQIAFRIRSLGWLNDYDPNQYFGAYQKLMKEPSMGLYRAYTHIGSMPDIHEEKQGRTPELKTPRSLESEEKFLARVKENVNGRLGKLLRAPPASLSPYDLAWLGQCFDVREMRKQEWIAYPGGHSAETLRRQAVAGIDAQVRKQSEKPDYVASQGNDSWGGYFGGLGDAIRLLWPRLDGSEALAEAVDYGGSYGRIPRRRAWARALRESVDFGRFHRRRVANQEMYCAGNLYRANCGLRLVDPGSALREAEALRYVKEAAGLLPFKGNDLPGDGPVPVPGDKESYDWRVVTEKGTSKDLGGFVGSDYGELGGDFAGLALVSRDRELMARALQMLRARAVFRIPAPDDNGFLVMQGANPIGVRNNSMPGHYAYLGRGGEFHVAMLGAKVVGNDLLGYYQQAVDDGQLFRMVGDRCDDPYLPMRYAAIKAMPKTGVRLPMSPGARDFAWADEDNLVVAAKHGEERFFANLHWRAPNAVNGWAKVFLLDDETVHIAEVQVEDVRYRPTGILATMGSRIEKFNRAQPPDNPVNAYKGQRLPLAFRSDLTRIPPENPDSGKGTGYTLRYGHWLVGINAHHAEPYELLLPSNFTQATDLVSGRTFTEKVELPPRSSAVFYLPDLGDPNPRPGRPLWLRAMAGNGTVSLKWSPAPSATRYIVRRASSPRGPYETIAKDVQESEFADTPPDPNRRYGYTVSGLNENGEGRPTPPASSACPAPGLLNRAPLADCSASAQNEDNESAPHAFDGDVKTKWYSGQPGAAVWLQADFGPGAAWTVSRYGITSANDCPERDPVDWELQGSSDGIAWVTLDAQAGQSFKDRFQARSYKLAKPARYRYFRLNISANAGGNKFGVQLAEWALEADRTAPPR